MQDEYAVIYDETHTEASIAYRWNGLFQMVAQNMETGQAELLVEFANAGMEAKRLAREAS